MAENRNRGEWEKKKRGRPGGADKEISDIWRARKKKNAKKCLKVVFFAVHI